MAIGISRNTQIKNINICFDNDDKGTKAAKAIAGLLATEYETKLMPPEVGKDYNDQLLIRKGIPKTVKTRCANDAINKEEITKRTVRLLIFAPLPTRAEIPRSYAITAVSCTIWASCPFVLR